MSFDGFVTFVRTRDLDRARYFYEGMLGLSVVLDQGSCLIFRVSDSGFLGVCRGEPSPQGVIFTLVATDVRERCAELAAVGVQFEKSVAYNAEFDITHAFLRDPDGHLVEIQRFESPDWPR
jgi:catechol 2,3-dioxygenase-like lactoylglutathione lyase family enzyme